MTKTFSFKVWAAVAAGLVAVAFLGFYFIALADSAGVSFEAPTYTVDSTINGIDGWTSTGAAGGGCAVYDHEVSSSFGVPDFGAQSLRISNAVTSGCFGDQTFAKPLTDAAGEADSTDGAFSRGTLQNHFEAEFSIRAMQLSQQPGLFMSVSPDRGDGSRMSYLGFEDTPGGINVIFYDTPGTGNPATFAPTTVATGLSRATTHTAKFVMDFVNGPSNDVVKIYIDGVLVHTGTSWENYFRFDSEAVGENTPRIVKTLIFRSGGTAAPATNGLGFLVDNLSLESSTVVIPPATLVVDDDGVVGLDNSCDGTGAIAYTTIQGGVNAANSGDTVQVCAGTYPENVSIAEAITVNGPNVGVSGNGARGAEATVSQVNITSSDVVVDGFSFTNAGIQMNINGATTLSGVQVQNSIFSGYSSVGMPTYNAGNLLITRNLFQTPLPSTEAMQIKADGSTLGGCNGTVVSDNVFIAASNNGAADINFSCTGSNSTGVTVSGNTDTGLADPGGTSFTAFSGVVGGIAVTNNNVTGTPTSGSAIFFFGGVTGSVNINNNVITGGGGNAISVNTILEGNNTGAFTITNNDLSGNAKSISLSDAFDAGASVTATRNNLSGDSLFGIRNVSTVLVADGTCNWWGAVNGPGPVGPGTGSNVTSNVTFSSWLTSADLNGACNGPLPGVTVTMVKNIEGVHATAASANSSSFPMLETWVATNFSGTDVAFDLSPSGINTANEYEAVTSPAFDSGADFTMHEVTGGAVVGASCAEGKPFALVGYSSGDTLALAQAATVSATEPNFTGMTTDKFIIVWNETCAPAPTTGTLIVQKTLVNDDGGALTDEEDFSFSVNGDPSAFEADGTNEFTLAPGAYSVVEGSASGYTTTYANSENANLNCNSLTLAAGETITCTITNDDNAVPPPPPPPVNACNTPTVAPAGYTLQNGTSASDNVTIAPQTMFVGKGGSDTVNGPATGNYIVCTGSGSDNITLGNGNFTIAADGGFNTITTGNGDGYISSGSTSDKITTGDGVQTIEADGGSNTIVTGNGNKHITTGSASDKITTGDGNDIINADGGSNTIKSGAGNDTITTGSGSDTVDGGADTDTCNVGIGFNTVTNCELP